MTKIKQNKAIARCIVAAGTLLACLGIWTSIVNFSTASQITATATGTNTHPLTVATEPNVSANLSNVLTSGMQTGIQTGQGSPTLASANQAAPIQPPPQLATAVTTPPATTPAQPPPTTTPPPKLITRGS